MATLELNAQLDLAQVLQTITQLGAPIEPALKSMGEYLVRSTLDRFESATAPDGTAWAPLLASVREAKKGPGILRESLRLKESVVWQLRPGALAVGTNLVYAAIHQFGGTTRAHVIRARRAKKLAFMVGATTLYRHAVQHPGSVMPARPYLGLSPADEQELLAIVQDYQALILGRS